MFSCLRWCFGGRPEDEETEKGNRDYNDPAKLDAEYQQIQRGIAERLANANTAERIRIRDMLRDKEEQWFAEGEVEQTEVRGGDEKTGGNKKEEKKVEEEYTGGSSSDEETGSLKAPRIRVMSPMMCSAPEPEPPMTAELQPVLNDLPDETRLCTSGHNEASNDESEFRGCESAIEAGDAEDASSLFAVSLDDN